MKKIILGLFLVAFLVTLVQLKALANSAKATKAVYAKEGQSGILCESIGFWDNPRQVIAALNSQINQKAIELETLDPNTGAEGKIVFRAPFHASAIGTFSNSNILCVTITKPISGYPYYYGQ